MGLVRVAVAKDRPRTGREERMLRLLRTLRAEFDRLAYTASLESLLQALVENDPESITTSGAWSDGWVQIDHVWRDANAETLRDVARSELSGLGIGFSFHLDNPYAAAWVRDHGAALLQASEDSKAAVRWTVEQGLVEGIAPRESARWLRSVLGNTERDAQAARTRLETLVDSGVKPERATALATRYAGQLLSARAETVARTETIAAEGAGQDAAWRTAQDRGLMSGLDTLQVWKAGQTEVTCEVCAALDGQAVPVGEPFVTDDGEQVYRQPAHVNCRCTRSVVTRVPGVPLEQQSAAVREAFARYQMGE